MARSFLLRGLAARGGLVQEMVWRLEGAGMGALWWLARSLPPRAAAALGGAMLGAIGPRLRKQRHVLANLERVLPGASDSERRRVARQVWVNAGRVLAEVPHTTTLLAMHTTLEVHPEVQAALRAGRPLVFCGGHLGNWELLLPVVRQITGACTVIQSPLQNPWMDRHLQRWRARTGCRFVDKANALRPLLRELQAGRSIGLLPDQRVPSGTHLPLFGEPAETTVSAAKLAQRAGAVLVPLVAVREAGERFRVTLEAPIPVPPDADPEAVMRQWHSRLEAWVTAHPGQWLCTKRRWAKGPATAR